MKKDGIGAAIMQVLEAMDGHCLDSHEERLEVAIALLDGIKQPIADIISRAFEK